MYRTIWNKYIESSPNFPTKRRPLVGSVIKETRIDKGIRQMDFAKQIKMNWSTLKSIKNDHQKATTVENLERCAKPLGLDIDQMILSGRERDPANCFILKKTDPTPTKGVRTRKALPPEWNKSIRFDFNTFDLTPISPPIATQKDFFAAKIVLPPKRSMENMVLGVHHQVMGIISNGFNIRISYAGTETVATTNQAFALDGYFPHTITNEDEDTSAIIYFVTKFPDFEHTRIVHEPSFQWSPAIDIAAGVKKVQRYKSERKDRSISVQHLADLTDNLDAIQLRKLMRIKKDSSVIYWDKIEDLLGGTGITMKDFLAWCHHGEKQNISVATPTARAVIDYMSFYSLKIYSVIPPRINPHYFIGELMIDGKNNLPRKRWEREENAMIAVCVMEGDLEIKIGTYRNPLMLTKGESIYFDGNLGYSLSNISEPQVRIFLATYPAIRF